jgi:hypothetical protein
LSVPLITCVPPTVKLSLTFNVVPDTAGEDGTIEKALLPNRSVAFVSILTLIDEPLMKSIYGILSGVLKIALLGTIVIGMKIIS